MEAPPIFLALLSFTLIIVSASIFCPCESTPNGFTVDIFRRDSPRSPYYDPAITPTVSMANAIRRSIARASRLSHKGVSPNTPTAQLIYNNGEYLMDVAVGSPPVQTVAIADTGSDLMWTQCDPCTNCFSQKAPLFNPSKSSTYSDISCQVSQCNLDQGFYCNGNNLCGYQYSYGDGSYTRGNVATETLTLDSTSGRSINLPKFIFGCGHENAGSFDDKTSGIIGLGQGPVSLISQMGNATGGKFSYCLVPFSSSSTNSSKLNFGINAVVSGHGAVSTPLARGETETFYYLTLEGISVGEERIDFPGSSAPEPTAEGNIIIDSGTTLTLMPNDFYSKLEEAVANHIGSKPVPDPTQLLSLCFSAKSAASLLPTLTFHFKGADVTLPPSNSFVATAQDVTCFAFATSDMGAIYGNIAQTNFLIGYDVQNQKLSFKATDCTQH